MASSSDRPERIGPYTIVDVLGEGGMGVVYLAEQSQPVRRTVALKILKPGLGSTQVVTRFQSEFQALAVMDHPSIAKVFDAGVTDDGRPYFVMERVTGSPISRYCDDHRLSLRERVRLFIDVCQAVQHAHQKGVIHRDLKPSNVLVSDVDGRPHPRIIDFGIAKAVAWAGDDDARLTREDQVVGTPAYMSPEQLDGSSDIDTRSDIYSLGVLLYELLVGTLPFDDDSYRGWAAVASLMLREPPTPRQRLDGMVDTRETVATLRGTTPQVLRKELGGDLDWIVSRAMEKDRSKRYETAVGLALELERYLAFEPVRARGAGTAYRVRRFVRRHRVSVGFGSTVAVGLVAFAITTSIQADRIARARDEAELRRDQAEGLIDFMLNDLWEKLEPIGRLEVLGDVGDQARQYFSSLPEDQFTDEELLSRSQALYQIGGVKLDEGRSAEAEADFRESLRLSKALVDRDPENAEWLYGLSQSHFYVGYAAWLGDDYDAVEEQFLAYLGVAETLVELQPDNLDYRMELGYAHSNIGTLREARGDLEGAVEAFLETLAVKRELVRRDPANLDWLGELAETHNHLGVVYRKLGAYDEALAQHTREHELKTEILEVDPAHAGWRLSLAMSLTYMATLHQETGRLPLAIEEQRETVQILDSLVAYDPSNAQWRRDAAVAHRELGQLLMRTGRIPAAVVRLRRARDTMEDLVRTDSTGFGWREDLGVADTELARSLLEAGRRAEALAVARAGHDLLGLDPDPERGVLLRRADSKLVLGRALEAVGRREEARESRLEALGIIEELLAGPGSMEFQPLHAEALLALGRVEDARAVLTEIWARSYADPYLARLAAERNIVP